MRFAVASIARTFQFLLGLLAGVLARGGSASFQVRALSPFVFASWGGAVNDLNAERVPSISRPGVARGERSRSIKHNFSATLVRGVVFTLSLHKSFLFSRRSARTSSTFRAWRLFCELGSGQPGSHPCIGFCPISASGRRLINYLFLEVSSLIRSWVLPSAPRVQAGVRLLVDSAA